MELSAFSARFSIERLSKGQFVVLYKTCSRYGKYILCVASNEYCDGKYTCFEEVIYLRSFKYLMGVVCKKKSAHHASYDFTIMLIYYVNVYLTLVASARCERSIKSLYFLQALFGLSHCKGNVCQAVEHIFISGS